jgi:DNA-binding NarL/FixJ family response regulator
MPSSTTSSEPTHVLLVDDNEAMLARAAAVLSPICIIVGAVKDGPSALQAAGACRPDVIVLDISMPGMNGLEVAVSLRSSGSTAAVVFLTVHDDEEIVNAAKAAGAIGFVVKPRLRSDLLHAVLEARAGHPFVSARQ